MCDTLCANGPRGTLFGKNSDRPSSEVQLIEAHPRRAAGGELRTQYLGIPDTGAHALMGARPEWLWGMEHGVNEHGVAIGNEKVWTTLDPAKQAPGLIGMDLVRLGLERGSTADEALEVITGLLEAHGQGGVCDETTGEAYFSSFLIADARGGWVLETSGRTWAADRVAGSAAISNRLTLGSEWSRASEDVSPGADWQAWRHPNAPTGHADVRLAASTACLRERGADITPAQMAAHLRDHGHGPWGAPNDTSGRVDAPPKGFAPDGTGVTVCMHLRGFQNTTSSMIAWLPADPDEPLRAWVAPGSPCVSVFVPVFPPAGIPQGLGDPGTWREFAELRDRVEDGAVALEQIRAALGPLETEMWKSADAAAGDLETRGAFLHGIRLNLT